MRHADRRGVQGVLHEWFERATRADPCRPIAGVVASAATGPAAWVALPLGLIAAPAYVLLGSVLQAAAALLP